MGPEFWGLPILWHGLSLELEGRWVAGLSALDRRPSCPVVEAPEAASFPVLSGCWRPVCRQSKVFSVSLLLSKPPGVVGEHLGQAGGGAVVPKTMDMLRPCWLCLAENATCWQLMGPHRPVPGGPKQARAGDKGGCVKGKGPGHMPHECHHLGLRAAGLGGPGDSGRRVPWFHGSLRPCGLRVSKSPRWGPGKNHLCFLEMGQGCEGPWGATRDMCMGWLW